MDSSSGSSPDNPKKLSNSEKNNLDSTSKISENSAIDEKNSKNSEMNQEKRKMTPQDSAEKSPNDFQSPRLKNKLNGTDENNSIDRITENSTESPKSNLIQNSLDITNQTNLMLGTNLENNAQNSETLNMEPQKNQTESDSQLPISAGNSTTTKKVLIQTNIMLGGILLNNSQSFSASTNLRSSANKNGKDKNIPNAIPIPGNTLGVIHSSPTNDPNEDLIGHASEHGLSLVTLHEYTGFPTNIPKSLSALWPILLERADTQTLRKKLELQGYLFWKLAHIIFCVSLPSNFVRLGIELSDFNDVKLTGKDPAKISTFPTVMDCNEGLEVLRLAIQKIRPRVPLMA